MKSGRVLRRVVKSIKYRGQSISEAAQSVRGFTWMIAISTACRNPPRFALSQFDAIDLIGQ